MNTIPSKRLLPVSMMRQPVTPVTLRLLRLSAGFRWWMALGTLIGLALTATYVGHGVAVAAALALVIQGRSLGDVVPLIGLAVALVPLRAALLWLRELVTVATGTVVTRRLRRRLYAHLFVLGPAHTANARTGTVQATVVDGVEKIEVYFSRFVGQFAAAVLGAGAILVGLAAVDPVVATVLVIACVAIAATPLLARRAQAERSGWFWGTWRRLGADYLDVLQGMATLKLFGATARHGVDLAARSGAFYRASIRFVAVANLRTGAMGLLSSAGNALAVGVGVVRLASGQLDPFGLLLVLLLAREAFRPLEELQRAYHSAYPAISAAEGIFALLDERPVVAPVPARAGVQCRLLGDIVLEDVSFGYDRSHPAVLDGLSLRIPEGSTVAVVGRSGAGKSTIAALLLRFFDPDSGRITWGGRDLSTVSSDLVRRHIAVVSQDTYLFHGTVRDNLRLGRVDADSAQIEAAARAAGVHDTVLRLPDGYDTVLGERGATLSGGERQRIAIARALLTDPRLLILDEATSSLDAETEREVLDALDRLSSGRTTLVVAHRLSSVRHADVIVLLDRGRVAGSGPHEDLLRSSAGYARLLAAQEVPA